MKAGHERLARERYGRILDQAALRRQSIFVLGFVFTAEGAAMAS
jgi:hypothetical protein